MYKCRPRAIIQLAQDPPPMCWSRDIMILQLLQPFSHQTPVPSQLEKSILVWNVPGIWVPIMLTRDQRGYVRPSISWISCSHIYLAGPSKPRSGQCQIIISPPAVSSPLKIVNTGHWSCSPSPDYCKYHHCWLFSIITVRPLPSVFR